MFQAFPRSWQLVKASYKVLRSDPELMVLPFISMIGVMIVSITFFLPMYFSGLLKSLAEEGKRSTGQTVTGVVVMFVFYVIMYTIIIFSNVALVGAAMMRLRGEDPTVRDGLRIASQHIRQIIGYAAISATLGVILNMIGSRDNIVGRIVAGLINFAWNVVTFLVVPVLVIENVGPVDAIKRSGALLRKTWGEQIVANSGVGLVLGLIMFAIIIVVGLPLILLSVAAHSTVLTITVIALITLAVTLIGVFGAALNGVFQAALYNYATTGASSEFFDESLIQGAFKPK